MFILSIDQGTTGTTVALVDESGEIVKKAYRELTQIYPKPGWVEHDPLEIWETVVGTVGEVCSGIKGKIIAIGISNQRETTILWNKLSGAPIHNAIVWQCRRTAGYCDELREHEDLIKEKTGLPLDAYFSGTKVKWLLDNRGNLNEDDILFGTVDSWLIWKLTDGKIHATDHTNASRTMLYNIREKRWDRELCELLDVPMSILPEVRRSVDDHGEVESIPCLEGVPILGVAGDQQAALFGQMCFDRGQMKNTYGTGCFLVMNTGNEAIRSEQGLVTTLAVDGRGDPCYALEGSIFIGGAVIQWLRDEIGILEKVSESERAALSVENNGGVYLVPAFVGLGTPHWDMEARGTIVGLTRGTNRNHIIRAALESMAYQSYDVLMTMERETGFKIDRLAVDGGAAVNDFLMQFQADIIDRCVARPTQVESTLLGVAYMAGLRAGVWKDKEEIMVLKSIEREFCPSMDHEHRMELMEGWHKAVRQAMLK